MRVSVCVLVSGWAHCLFQRLRVCPYACYVSESVSVYMWMCECVTVST